MFWSALGFVFTFSVCLSGTISVEFFIVLSNPFFGAMSEVNILKLS